MIHSAPRMRRNTLIWLPLLVALLAPPAADAAAGPSSETAKKLAPQALLALNAGDGYLLSIEGTGRTVSLTVERRLSLATYVARGRASRGAIQARFGNFGRVSVRFVPSGRRSLRGPPRRCEGDPMILRRGVFVGRIEFRGEGGYVNVAARRAIGLSSSLPRWRCNHGRRGSRASTSKAAYETATLKASASRRNILFEAAALRDLEGATLAFFSVFAKERKGSVRIVRNLLAVSSKRASFDFDKDGRGASVRPPKPFHGSAAFQRTVGRPASWTGSLGVSLPGAFLELTGPDFTARMSPPTLLDEEFELTRAAQLARRPKLWPAGATARSSATASARLRRWVEREPSGLTSDFLTGPLHSIGARSATSRLVTPARRSSRAPRAAATAGARRG
jgi:hypothetical protein